MRLHIRIALSCLCFLPLLAAAGPPNVIVIMTDDQGYGDFSFNGNPILQTPNIDRLAEESLRFTDFHVAPMCTPTRSQFMTGMDAFRTGAINVSSGRALMKAELKTIANVFKGAGYRTGIFGKWHLGDNYPFRPEDRGFDETLWFPSSHINSVPDYWDNDYFDDTYIHNGERRKYEGYCTDVFFGKAAEWATDESGRDQPFFAYIALNAAHWPHFVPDHYRKPIQQAIEQNPDAVRDLPEHKKEELISFLAMGASIDDNIGKLGRFLESSGLRDNTIIVFLTDNGSTFGADYYNAGMRGGKTTLWEGGHRVPLLIRWPNGGLLSARDIDELSQVQDLLPTLAELAGITDLPEGIDGQSLAPILRDERVEIEDRMLVINYSRMPHFNVTYTDENPAIPQRDGAAVLWRSWRLLENRELYDVRTDPHQDNDVAAPYPGVVAKMRAHLEEWWAPIEEDVMKPERVIIGSEAENPSLLTACEWLDVFVDMQAQVRQGVLATGIFHLEVARAGAYRFTLRRWPEESGLRLTEGAPQTHVTDGIYPAGRAIPITGAYLKIQDQEVQEATAEDGSTSIEFTATLPKGPIELEATFTDAHGEPLVGAYYVEVQRL